MTDDLIARPGDPALDCHLTGLRLSAVIESPTGGYQFEATLGFDGSEASGWWVSDGERADIAEVTRLDISYGYDVLPEYELHAMLQRSRLREWRDTGAVIEMTSAPGKWTLLSSGDQRVVVPRKWPVAAGSGL